MKRYESFTMVAPPAVSRSHDQFVVCEREGKNGREQKLIKFWCKKKQNKNAF